MSFLLILVAMVLALVLVVVFAFLFFLVAVVVLFLFFLLLIITMVFALVLVFVAVVLTFLVVVFAFFGLVVLELQRRLGVGSLDHDTGDVIAQGFERPLQPRLQFDTVHRDDVRFSDRDQVARREFERVPFSPGRHERNNLHPVAADTLGEVLHRVDARDHEHRLGRTSRGIR